MKLGIDISTQIEENDAQVKYFDNGVLFDPLKRFKDNGVSLIRLRIWNDPYSEDGKPYLGGTNDLKQLIKLINLTKEYGYQYIIDFHYSDFWVDPNKQIAPKAWKDLSFEEVLVEVAKFTKEVLVEVKKLGVEVPYVQIGNEITNGMIWPFGKVDYEKEDGFKSFNQILKSGIKAARDVFKDTKIIIHLENSSNQVIYNRILSDLEKEQIDYDIIGMSYYPYWHGTFDELFANIEMCRNKFHKNIMIMELGFGFTLEDYMFNENGQSELKVNKDNLEAELPYDITPEGQALFIEDFLSRCEAKNLEGVVYWEPIWIPGDNICWSSIEGQAYIHEEGKSTRNEWANQCLVDYKGNKLPSFDKFRLKKEDK